MYPATFGHPSLQPSPQPFLLSLSISGAPRSRQYHSPDRQRMALARTGTPKTRQYMPVGTVSVHWARQYVAHSSATVLVLHPYQHVEHLLLALYHLATLEQLRRTRHRRPHRRGTAGTEMITTRARVIPSSSRHASYT